jgi:4-hydroxy-2-oxoheptanedioate aldolase
MASLLEKLQARQLVFGLSNMYPAAAMIEGMCRGWDFVWIDGQHGQISYDAQAATIRAAAVIGVATLVRVPGHEPGIIGPVLDLAPDAIMIPMVNNAVEAAHIAAATHFAPCGNRSYGGRRVIDLYGREYYRQHQPLVVAQIETIEAVENAAHIAATEGIDVLFFGPDDMKVQFDLPINSAIAESAPLRDAMQKTARAARDAGKFAGCVAPNAATVKICADMGYHLLVGGGDAGFLRTAAADKLAEVRGAAPGQREKDTTIY